MRWSRYNPSYLEPEVKTEAYQKRLEELTEEEKEQMELKAVRPIKAAPPTLSSSVFSDPMIRSEKAAAPPLSKNAWEHFQHFLFVALLYLHLLAAHCLLLQHNPCIPG